MKQRAYIRNETEGFSLVVDGSLHSSLDWVGVCDVIIELTKILRHGKGDVTLRIDQSAIELSFFDAVDLITQATLAMAPAKSRV